MTATATQTLAQAPRIFCETIRMKHGRFVLPRNKRTGRVIADLQEMAAAKEEGVLVQEMITTSDTQEFFATGINDFFLQDNPDEDRQWEQLFREIGSTKGGELLPFRDPDEAGTGSHGIVFEKVDEGGEIKFSKVTSKERYVKAVKYATAIGYSTEWFEDGDLGLIEMTTQDFRQAAADKMALIHYGLLLEALKEGGSETTKVEGKKTIDDLIKALDGATAKMRRHRYSPSILVGAPEQESMIQHALHDVHRDRTRTESARRLRPLITDYFPSGTMALIHPRKRLVSIRREDLRLDSFEDLMRDAHTVRGKFRRGAALLDPRAVHGVRM